MALSDHYDRNHHSAADFGPDMRRFARMPEKEDAGAHAVIMRIGSAVVHNVSSICPEILWCASVSAHFPFSGNDWCGGVSFRQE